MTNEEEVRQRWKGHFVEVLNRPNPKQAAEVLSKVEMIEEIPSGPITKAEIRISVTGISASKASGVDSMTAELLKADITTAVDVLHNLSV